jgi:hypothetical protein
MRGKEGGRRKGGEMTQTLYAHMNERFFFNKKRKVWEEYKL